MTEPEFEAQFDKHDMRCELEGEKEKYEVKLQIHPKVTFKQGKAVKAKPELGQDRSAEAGQDGIVVGHGRGQFLRRAAECAWSTTSTISFRRDAWR